MLNFPKKLYVVIENQGKEDEFLLSEKNIEELAVVGEKKRIGVYTLQNTACLEANVNITLVPFKT